MKKELIARYPENEEDIVELYDLHIVKGEKPFRLIVTTFGAIDEDGEEVGGWGAMIDLVGRYKSDNEIIKAVFDHFKEEGEKVELHTVTDYDSYINSRYMFTLNTEDSPERTREICDEIAEIMKDAAQTETKSLITRLFEAMRNDLGVMAEHDDSETSLFEELNNASRTLLEAYEGLYIN